MKPSLGFERFSELVAAYGGRLEVWPDDVRAAAEALLETSDAARVLVAAEGELDLVLVESNAEPSPSAELMRRLNEIPVRVPQRRVWWPFRRAWVPAVGWAFAAAVGVGWGLVAPFEESELSATSALSVDSAAPESPLAADDDMTALARGTLVEFQESP